MRTVLYVNFIGYSKEGVLLFNVNFLILLWLLIKCQADCSLYFSISATVTVDVLWHVGIYIWTDAGVSEGRVWVEGQGKRGTAPSVLRSVSLTVRCGFWRRAPFRFLTGFWSTGSHLCFFLPWSFQSWGEELSDVLDNFKVSYSQWRHDFWFGAYISA
jgi:hypothetical protein